MIQDHRILFRTPSLLSPASKPQKSLLSLYWILFEQWIVTEPIFQDPEPGDDEDDDKKKDGKKKDGTKKDEPKK